MKKAVVTMLLALLAAVVLALSCGENAFDPAENLPPETGLASTGDSLHTTLYLVNLKWWGSDADGEVNGFEYRWIIPEGTEAYDLDTSWTYTGFVKKDFLLPVPDSTEAFRFEVRALDNRGAVDPTPASQIYPFYNNRPDSYIRYPELLPDSTWPVIAFGWEAGDRDGDSTIAKHLIWVGGKEGSPVVVPGELDTVLLLPADLDTSGPVTIYLQTVDDGYSAGFPDSFNVHLIPLYGKTLLVDDYPPPSIQLIDNFYRNVLSARLGADGYTILNLYRTPFDTDVRFGGLLTAFDDVVWYTGNRQRSVPEDQQRFEQMRLAEMGLGRFLSRGGDLFLSSLNAVGTLSGLTGAFHREYIGFDTLYTRPVEGGVTTTFTFQTAGGAPPPWEVPFHAVEGTGLPDLELLDYFQYVGIDAPLDTIPSKFRAERLYRVDPGAFVTQTAPFYPMIRYDLPSPGGQVVLSTFPFALYAGAGTNDEALNLFLDWFGVPGTRH
ncbi:MAG: hypothetical protein ABIK65_10740 [Candidatus Eisenbacteria bacterium]